MGIFLRYAFQQEHSANSLAAALLHNITVKKSIWVKTTVDVAILSEELLEPVCTAHLSTDLGYKVSR